MQWRYFTSIAVKETLMPWFGYCLKVSSFWHIFSFSDSHPPKNQLPPMLPLEGCWWWLCAVVSSHVKTKIPKYPKINLVFRLDRFIFLCFGFCFFWCSHDVCSVWSSSQSDSQHCVTLISMYLYVKNPSGEHRRSFTLDTHTLLIGILLSLTVFFFFLTLASCHTKVDCTPVYSGFPTPMPVTRQETERSDVKAHICLGTWKWEQWPDVKTM